MATSQQLLEQAAQDGSWDTEDWPAVLEDVLARLDKIVHAEFPLPVRPPEPPPPAPAQLGSPLAAQSSQDSQASNKENAPAKPAASSPRPPVPAFSASASATADNNTQDEEAWPSTFPPDLAAQHRSVKKSLKSGFPRYPPHTIQRLAELILWPQKHYRFLPSYLNALDRVVSVQSTTTLFPLPVASLPSTGGMLNGASAVPVTTRQAPELGSDESLGGALLTPIPWLAHRRDSQPSTGSSSGGNSTATEKELQTSSTEMVQGPNGAGRIETVNVVNGVMTSVTSSPVLGLGSAGQSTEETLRAEGAVTQGELLRQEQQAGIVPVQPRSLRLSDQEMDELTTAEHGAEGGEDGERAHARGPDEIGDEDIGPQDRPVGGHLDLEAAVGRSRRESSADPEDASLSDAGGGREEDMLDADPDNPEKSSAILDDEDDVMDAAAGGEGNAESKPAAAMADEGK